MRQRKSPADSPRRSGLPRKIVVGSAIYPLWREYPGLEGRLKELGSLVEEMTRRAAERFTGARLDLAVLPEFALTGSRKRPLDRAAIPLSPEVVEPMGDLARQCGCYVVLPLHLVEEGWRLRYFNAAAVLDRRGKPLGVYRYVHPSAQELEGGISPGGDYPVFECDFGRIGIQFCGEVGYPDGWRILRRKGAELIAFPTQPGYPTQVAARAMANRLYVLSSPWRGRAALHDPLGQVVAETGKEERVLVERIDLSYALLGWQEELAGGKVFDETYGPRAGYRYHEEEDWGIFWSNDPETPIAEMVRHLGLKTLDAEHRASLRAQKKTRGRGPNHR